MKPPFSVSNLMLNQMVEISNLLGQLAFHVERNLKLRKENRIKSIHSSLAIENNSLTVEQITAIINGKRVLGDPREIQEVKNAYDAYEEILTLKPYEQKDFLKAHGLLTKDIVNRPGQYRNEDVGIYDSEGTLIHAGARPQFLGNLMTALFDWGANDDTPELIKSCVFHYEIETIHPFEDGNGRMGRLWQTVILANWNPIFSWIPIETLIYENQSAYYDALAQADVKNDSSSFVEFMLDIILTTLREYQEVVEIPDGEVEKVNESLSKEENRVFLILSKYLQDHETVSTAVASKLSGKSEATARRYLKKYIDLGLMIGEGLSKARIYRLLKK